MTTGGRASWRSARRSRGCATGSVGGASSCEYLRAQDRNAPTTCAMGTRQVALTYAGVELCVAGVCESERDGSEGGGARDSWPSHQLAPGRLLTGPALHNAYAARAHSTRRRPAARSRVTVRRRARTNAAGCPTLPKQCDSPAAALRGGLLRSTNAGPAGASPVSVSLSDDVGQFVEPGRDATARVDVDSEFVMASP
jgi:hypothetical protein